MENLVVLENGKVLVSSRQIAENFGKRHDNIIRDIEAILGSSDLSSDFFSLSQYENRGKQYPEYQMNRDGFTLLAMGFNGKRALEWKIKYIAAFNAMEAQLAKPKEFTQIELLEIALTNAKRVAELEATVEEQKPAVEFVEALHGTESMRSVAETAKVIQQSSGIPMGQKRLFAYMREHGYLGKRESTDYNIPTQKSMNLELFVVKHTAVDRTQGVKIESTPRVTGKGLSYFVNKFIKMKQKLESDALEEAGKLQLAAMEASSAVVGMH